MWLWQWFLEFIGARAATKMSLAAAIKAYRAGELTLEAAAAACDLSAKAFLVELETAAYIPGAAAEAAAAAKAAGVASKTRDGYVLLSWPGLIAGVISLIALGVGIVMYQNWGKPDFEPVLPGPAMTNRNADSSGGGCRWAILRNSDFNTWTCECRKGWTLVQRQPEDRCSHHPKPPPPQYKTKIRVGPP